MSFVDPGISVRTDARDICTEVYINISSLILFVYFAVAFMSNLSMYKSSFGSVFDTILNYIYFLLFIGKLWACDAQFQSLLVEVN